MAPRTVLSTRFCPRGFWLLRVALCALLVAMTSACMRAEGVPGDRLVIFAASSLREVFRGMGHDFARAHPGVDVAFHFAGTQELRAQLELGASADVFAAADTRHMDALVAAGLVSSPVVFARNELVLVTSREGASGVRSLVDLPAAARIVVGAPQVPIGRYTAQMLERASQALGADFSARVDAKVVSRELQVAQVLARVSLGEADAGIVYHSDARLAGDRAHVVDIPPEFQVVADYPLAPVSSAARPDLARAWIDFVLSAQGQRVLVDAGFAARGGPP